VRGVELLELDRHPDARGSLIAFGGDSPLPFDVEHVYFILDCPSGTVRAEHAATCHTAIIALSSSVTVDVDNGSEQASHRLTGPDTVLVVRAGVWLRLREFSEGTRLVVLSSSPYEDMTHFDHPAPELLDDVA
jgi:WxcM-like, C-terminal